MPSTVDVAKRQLVRLLRELGQTYGVQVGVTRESPPLEVKRAFRSVARKAHPDKPGGCTKDFQALSARHDAWADLHRAERHVGRPPKVRPPGGKAGNESAVALPISSSPEQRRELRITATLAGRATARSLNWSWAWWLMPRRVSRGTHVHLLGRRYEPKHVGRHACGVSGGWKNKST